MNPILSFILYLAVMASVTYLLRLLPMLIFKKKIQNKFVRSFLYYVPYAVLAVMTFPAIIHGTASIISGAAAAVVALILAFFDRSLITVATGAAVAVLLSEFIIGMI